VIEFLRVERGEVAQATVFQPTPQGFYGVEHRSVGWQLLQGQPRPKALGSFTNRISLMHAAAVPKDNHPIRDFSHQRLQEGRRTMVVEVVVEQGLNDQSQLFPTPRRPPQGCCDRNFVSLFAALFQYGSLAPGRPCPPNQGSHQKPTFIDENQARMLAMRFFLIRNHSDVSQAAITSGSRSRGTRSGFCSENPCIRSQRGKYRALNEILHSCRISSASFAAVQSSVSNPCSLGLSSNQRRTIFSWVRLSLLGRPGTGRASRPGKPSRWKADNHRRMLLASTAKNSATSSAEYPSRTLCTAKHATMFQFYWRAFASHEDQHRLENLRALLL